MNIVVGYVQSNGDPSRQDDDVRALTQLGCQVVRVEAAEAPDKLLKPVLEAVCDFLGPGDELLTPDITHLGASPNAAQAFLSRLEARGARVRLLVAFPNDAHVAVVTWRRPSPAPTLLGGRIDAGAVRALSDQGFGPSQIARKLGVSRMTIWRKLAAAS